ncbi:hypothetical protein [Rhizobium leguminosarum]|uniref:hypothetical protein n=1 Tax=Rhizobium leguminosarum TaxID=384 RepID=UPI0013BC80DA|nr:hypothetical protein [Rhizobium leguminosarum]NEI64964.1 hypothetical protein [Rhizobium leguminosarum]NZD54174.1 hypothetical protein [Rhizobium leguminosarum]
MTPENIDHLRTVYKRYYHTTVDSLPDGWVAIIDDFFLALEGVGDLNEAVSVRLERTLTGLKAFAFPEVSRWHPEQSNALRAAQRGLYGLSQQTCEICGNPGAADGDGPVLCIGHATEAAGELDRAKVLYDECRILFPEVHGKAIDLSVPDYMFDLLSNTLRAILKLVVEEDIVGKVLITRIEWDGEALFVRVRYQNLEAVFMGTQMAINEMVADLETLSDELTRKHQHGGSDAS